MEHNFTPAELKMHYPRWVTEGHDKNDNPIGRSVVSPEDHFTRFPDHYEHFIANLNPPPKSEEELTAAIMAEREECIKFVQSYPSGKVLMGEIAKAMRKSRNAGVSLAKASKGKQEKEPWPEQQEQLEPATV